MAAQKSISELSDVELHAALKFSFISLNEYDNEVARRRRAERDADGGSFFSPTDPDCATCKELGHACIDHETEECPECLGTRVADDDKGRRPCPRCYGEGRL